YRRHDHHALAPRGEGEKGRRDRGHHGRSHQYLFGADRYALPPAVPGGNRLEVLSRRQRIAEYRMLAALADGLEDRGRGGEVHVRDPEGDYLRKTRPVLGILPFEGLRSAAVDDSVEVHGHLY